MCQREKKGTLVVMFYWKKNINRKLLVHAHAGCHTCIDLHNKTLYIIVVHSAFSISINVMAIILLLYIYFFTHNLTSRSDGSTYLYYCCRSHVSYYALGNDILTVLQCIVIYHRHIFQMCIMVGDRKIQFFKNNDKRR